MVKLLYIVLSLVMVSCPPWAPAWSDAAAQDTADDQERARRLFEHGLGLAESERWAEALSAFRRSAALVERPSTSYNIANALYRLDRPVEGLAELDKYDMMPEVRSSVEARERGDYLRDLLESAIAEVQLEITPADATVFVDDRRATATGQNRQLRINPGAHSIRVTYEGYDTYRKDIWVERGSRRAYKIALQPRITPEPASPALPLASTASSSIALGPSEPAPADDDRERFVKRPGFWAMIAAIAAVGVGVGVAVAVTRNNDSPPCGTTGDCATTQGLTVTSF